MLSIGRRVGPREPALAIAQHHLENSRPIEVVAKRVNASVDTIETYYDQEDPRRELEHRRRTHLSNLQLEDNEGNPPEPIAT